MAMNKKEKARVEFLETMLALHPTERILPDVPIPENLAYGEVVPGYSYNAYSVAAYESCSSSMYHAYRSKNKTSSHGGIEQYSTMVLALRAMRRDIEIRCATELREADLMIEAELNK